MSRRRERQGEFALIESLRVRFASKDAGLIRGIGEDAAIVKTSSRDRLLLTTDLLTEGIHFDLATTSLEDIGYRSAIANLSDIASMGGRPRYLLVAIAVPQHINFAAIRRLYRGLMQACRPFNVHLIGGDTSASRHDLFISITLTGAVEAARALQRNGAHPGDFLYVTGTVGDSRAGLMLLQERKSHVKKADPAQSAGDRFLLRRHHKPSARIEEGRWLATKRLATAAIDLSDGLAGDLRHLCDESRVGAEVDCAALPISSPCLRFAHVRGLAPADLALAGGEDYELLFTVNSRNRSRMEREAARLGYRCTCIGQMKPASFGLRMRTVNGSLEPLAPVSYEHFRPTS
ncbi:thiamine-phosphate kinase [Nitrospira sp. Nam80]